MIKKKTKKTATLIISLMQGPPYDDPGATSSPLTDFRQPTDCFSGVSSDSMHRLRTLMGDFAGDFDRASNVREDSDGDLNARGGF